mgnify:CR=1 FL=1
MSNNNNTQQFYRGVGRRKTSTAVVRLFDEKGELLINGSPISEYFPGEKAEIKYTRPFEASDMPNKFSADIKVSGGGRLGQLDAVVLGIARALLEYDESLKDALNEYDLLTRDPRMKERKKIYHRGARRSPQFSKR